MVTKQITKLPKSEFQIQVTVAWPEIEPKWNDTLQKLAQDLELPGFRKGAAPIPMVEQNLGPKLQDEALKIIMPQALIEALQGTDIVPIDYPKYQVISFQKGSDLVFSAAVTGRPIITVGDYKGLKVPHPEVKTITDADVDKVIQELFKRWGARQPASNTAQPDAGGQASQPAGSLNFNGQPQTPVPAQQAESPASAPDDTFAKAVGGTNLADLKIKIKQDLETDAKYNSELDYDEAVLQAVEKITTVDSPDILVEDELNRMLLSLQRQVTERGLLLDEYLKGQNQTVDQLKNKWKDQAARNVRMELGLSEIAKSEGVVISDQELQAEIDKAPDNRTKAQLAQEEPRMHLRHALRQNKTLKLLKSFVG